MIIVLLFVIFATPFFSLHPDKIEIVLKPEPVFDRSAIESLVADFSGKNIFSISTKEVFDALSGNIRHIASVEKTLLIPDGMRVTITSFPAAYRAYIGEEVFLLTENGQLIPDIAEVEVPKISIFHLVQDTNIAKKTPILPEDMQAISTIIESWSMHMKKNIEKLSFYEQEKELHILSE